jgi:hypothetical protein
METKKDLLKALLNAQKSIDNAKKNNTNPHLKSKYADLNSVREAIIPILNEVGVIVLQPMITFESREYIQTMLIHEESGQTIESNTLILCKAQNDPQAYGSGVSYARRYGLSSLMCIGAEDDDAQQAKNMRTVLKEEDANWLKVKEAVNTGISVNSILEKYRMSKETEKILRTIELGGEEAGNVQN